jgi:hypothetical protein
MDVTDEFAWSVNDDQLFAAQAWPNDLDLAGQHGEEAIGQCALLEENLTGRGRSALTMLKQAIQLDIGEARKETLTAFGAERGCR